MIKADRMMLTRHQFWSHRGDEGYVNQTAMYSLCSSAPTELMSDEGYVNQTAMYSLCSSGPTEVMRVMLTRQPCTHSVVLVQQR